MIRIGSSTRFKKKSPSTALPLDKADAISFLNSGSDSSIYTLPMSKSQFLDIYSKRLENVSNTPQPECFMADELVMAPVCYREQSRQTVVKRYANLPHWQQKDLFKKLVGTLRKKFNVVGVTISVVTEDKALIKIESGLGFKEIPRYISLDAHAMLSSDHFLVLNTHLDWRLKLNPFITGAPFIKFYCGVPLLSKKNEIIGILAIHDSFCKSKFSIEQCKELKEHAQDIVKMLQTPIDDLIKQRNQISKNLASNEIYDLNLKIGRATSTKSLIMTVFEKDGSGGRYSQNQDFHFAKNLIFQSFGELNNKDLWIRLAKIKSIKTAAEVLTKAFCRYYQFDFVYIIEIKTSYSCQIDTKYFPVTESEIEFEKFQNQDKINRVDNNYDCKIRVIGLYGTKISSIKFDKDIHYQAFTSDYGIGYKSLKTPSLYESGVILPFHKHGSKLIKNSRDQKTILDVNLKCGGYMIGMFNEFKNNFTPEIIENVYKDAMTFRKIYIS